MSLRERIDLVSGDQLPRITVDVIAGRGGDPVTLTGLTSASLKLRALGTEPVLATIACDIEPPSAVAFEFPEGALDVPAGEYEGEIELIFGTRPHTLFTPLRFRVRAQF